MSAQRDYWSECIASAAADADIPLTPEQVEILAGAAESGHENYGMAFYSPPASDRLADIRDGWQGRMERANAEWERKYEDLDKRFDWYRRDAARELDRLRDALLAARGKP